MFNVFDLLPPSVAYNVTYKKPLIKMRLNSLGYNYNRGGVKDFQRNNNLDQTGNIDMCTASSIFLAEGSNLSTKVVKPIEFINK